MTVKEFFDALIEHNDKKGWYQIHLNSANIENDNKRIAGVEFGELYFSNCKSLADNTLLCFSNEGRQPIGKKEDGTNVYPMEINSSVFIELSKIESIENVEDCTDWFEQSSSKVINVYMASEDGNTSSKHNVVTIGLME